MSSAAQTIEFRAPSQETGKTAPRAARPRRVSGRWLLLAGATIVAIAGAADYGWHYWTTGRFEVSTDDAYVKADSTIIAPKVGGYLSEVLVRDNQPVKAEEVLAKIDDRDYVLALARARADVAAAQAEIDNLNATIDHQQAVIAQAAGTVAVDKATLTFAEQDYARYVDLATRGVGTVQNAQQATSKRDAAQASLARDGAALKAAQLQTKILRAQLVQANAALEQKRAIAQQAELNLGYTTITAPVDGMVGNRTLRVGQFVQAGTDLMAIVPIERVYIVANYKETQLTDVRKGQLVAIGVDTFPGVRLEGHVDSIAPASGQEFALLPPDNATGNFTKVVQRIPVKIVLETQSELLGLLRPGMSVVPVVNTKKVTSGDHGQVHAASN